MKLATGILILGLGLGTAGAQNPSIIDNTKAKVSAVQQQKTADSNAALAASHGQSANAQTPSTTKPAAAPAKPAASKPTTGNVAATSSASKVQAASKPTTGNVAAASSASKLQAVSKPATGNVAAASSASKVQAVSKPTSVAVSKAPASTASQKAAPAAGKQASATASPFTAPKATAKTATSAATAASKTSATKATATKAATPETKNKKKTTTVSVKKPAPAKSTVAVEDKKNPDPKKDEHKSISMAGGRRDPFLSPVVNHSMGGSGCSTGKRCLAVDQIALQGIVKSDAGMIAVVVNAMNKAYFLRENDPVFNGYVVKITGDSIVFKETLQDKLGKSFTREVTKKISTPAV